MKSGPFTRNEIQNQIKCDLNALEDLYRTGPDWSRKDLVNGDWSAEYLPSHATFLNYGKYEEYKWYSFDISA